MKCKHGAYIIVVGFSPRWPHSSVPWFKRGSRGGKPVLFYYGYHDDGTLCTGKASSLKALLSKQEIHKRKKYFCFTCRRGSVLLVKHKDDIVPCPNCDG